MPVSLEATNSILPSQLYTNSILPLVANLAVFKATLVSQSIAPKDKGQVTKAGNYLAEWLETVVLLVNKSMPTVVPLYNAIKNSEGGGWRGPGKTLLFDVSHRLAHRVPLTKLVKLGGDISLYLAILMVATLVWVGEALVMHGRHTDCDDKQGSL